MASSNTPPNNQESLSNNAVTLTIIKESLSTWRQNKRTRSERIPENLWDMIISLLQKNPNDKSRVLSELGITRQQLDKEQQRRQSINSTVEPKPEYVEEVDFCEVTNVQEHSYPLAYKPAEAFSTTTSVVELYRKDGALMKIHICTERFDELLRAFFNGCQ